MLNRFATLAAVCMLMPVATAPLAAADPDPEPPVPVVDVGPPPVPANGIVASAEPGIARTADGRTLTVTGRNETEMPVAPLTTAVSSREYIVSGTFTGAVTGSGSGKLSGGTLEAGYQIGCGINAGKVKQRVTVVVSPTFGMTGLTGASASVTGLVEVEIKPGTITTVVVDKKTFEGSNPRIIIGGFRVKVDGCIGQSFIRSYATLTSSTDTADDVVSYTGVTLAI